MTRNRARTLGLAGTLGLVLPAAAACGIQPSGITTLGPAPAAAAISAAPSFDATTGSDQFLLFFYQGSQLSPVYRPASGGATEAVVLDALLAGPTPSELKQGYVTLLPPKMSATANASGQRDAYLLNVPLPQRAKAEFICTMQYFDQTVSVGIQIMDSNVNWNACSDTTNQFIPQMQGNTAAGTTTFDTGG